MSNTAPDVGATDRQERFEIAIFRGCGDLTIFPRYGALPDRQRRSELDDSLRSLLQA
jgi:hypothetical protein